MTISAAYNPTPVPNLPRLPRRRRKVRRFAALIGLALLLSGCIDPSAPPLGAAPPTVPALPGQTNPPPTGQSNATVVPPTPAPPTPVGATPPPQPLPLAPDGLWGKTPVGPESASILFFHNPPNTGPACISYVFRTSVVQHCATGNQPLVLVAGTIQPADNKQYILVAGRALSGQVSGVTIEYADGTSKSMAISAGGFAWVIDGLHKPLDVVPIDQYGNLVGGKVPF